MDQLTQYLNKVTSFKPCYTNDIIAIMGLALMTVIVKELMRLGYTDYESVRFDSKKAIQRGLGRTVGVCYYSTSRPADCIDTIEIEGKCYCLLEDYKMSNGYPDNRSELQSQHLNTLEAIYNYLRLERKSNSLKKSK